MTDAGRDRVARLLDRRVQVREARLLELVRRLVEAQALHLRDGDGLPGPTTRRSSRSSRRRRAFPASGMLSKTVPLAAAFDCSVAHDDEAERF